MSDVSMALAPMAFEEPPPAVGGVWRFYSVRFGGGGSIVLGELPMLSTSITERLGGTGELRSSVPIFDRSLLGNPALIDPESVMVVAERDGVIQFAGPLVDGPLGSESANTAQITALGGWQIVRDREIRSAAGMTYGSLAAGEVRFNLVDQFAIVEDLIDHLSDIREDVPITVEYPGGLSGVQRDRSYEADKGKSIGEAIEQLALVQNGFEWLFLPSGTADDLTFQLVLRDRVGRSTPYRFELIAAPKDPVPELLADTSGDVLQDTTGRALSSGELPDYRIVGSSNVLSATVGRTSSDRVSRFTAVGPGEGAAQLVEHVADEVLGDRLRMIERSGSWPDVTRRSTLRGHAAYNLAINVRAATTVVVTADPKADPPIGAVHLGDVVGVRIDKGIEQFDGDCRIVTRTINISADGAETATYELVPIERFA